MAIVVDFSTELFSKSGTTRFGKVNQFYGLSKTGKTLTRRQTTEQETAVDYLTRSLRRVTKDSNAILAFSDEMASLPQLSYMNMPVLAVTLVYIDELSADYDLDPNNYSDIMGKIEEDPTLFTQGIEKFLSPDQLDLIEELSDSQQIKMKENIFRYVHCVMIFRDQRRLVRDETVSKREREIAEQNKSLEDEEEEDEFLDQGPDDIADEDEEDQPEEEPIPIDVIIPEPSLALTRMTLPKLSSSAFRKDQAPPAKPSLPKQSPPKQTGKKPASPSPAPKTNPVPPQGTPRQRSGRPLPQPPLPSSDFVPQLLSPTTKSLGLPPPILGSVPPPKPVQPGKFTSASAAAQPKPASTPASKLVKPKTVQLKPSSTFVPPAFTTLQKRITPILPVTLDVQPLPTLSNKLEDVEAWFYDSENRLRLSPKRINFVGQVAQLPNLNKVELVKNMAAFDSYRDFATKLALQGIVAGPRDQNRKLQLQRGLQNLLNGKSLDLTRNDLATIASKIFPNAVSIKVPSEGECYFCAIAENLENKTSSQVRKDLVTYFTNLRKTNPAEFRSQIQFAALSCDETSLLGSTPVDQRPDLIFKLLSVECKQGMTDCTDCIWGNAALNDIMSEIYKIPVILVDVNQNAENGADAVVVVEASTPAGVKLDLNYTGPVIGILSTLQHFDALLL